MFTGEESDPQHFESRIVAPLAELKHLRRVWVERWPCNPCQRCRLEWMHRPPLIHW